MTSVALRLTSTTVAGIVIARSVKHTPKNNGASDRRKHTKLPVDTFLKRFLCHVLPERFMRIRHYGFLANRYRRERLGRIRCLLGVPPRERLETPATVEWLAALLGIDLARCPCCGGPLSQREIPRDESYWQGAAAKQPARAPPRKGAA